MAFPSSPCCVSYVSRGGRLFARATVGPCPHAVSDIAKQQQREKQKQIIFFFVSISF